MKSLLLTSFAFAFLVACGDDATDKQTANNTATNNVTANNENNTATNNAATNNAATNNAATNNAATNNAATNNAATNNAATNNAATNNAVDDGFDLGSDGALISTVTGEFICERFATYVVVTPEQNQITQCFWGAYFLADAYVPDTDAELQTLCEDEFSLCMEDAPTPASCEINPTECEAPIGLLEDCMTAQKKMFDLTTNGLSCSDLTLERTFLADVDIDSCQNVQFQCPDLFAQ